MSPWNVSVPVSCSVSSSLESEVVRLMEGAGECSILFCFLEGSVWNWCYFFLDCPVEFGGIHQCSCLGLEVLFFQKGFRCRFSSFKSHRLCLCFR